MLRYRRRPRHTNRSRHRLKLEDAVLLQNVASNFRHPHTRNCASFQSCSVKSGPSFLFHCRIRCLPFWSAFVDLLLYFICQSSTIKSQPREYINQRYLSKTSEKWYMKGSDDGDRKRVTIIAIARSSHVWHPNGRVSKLTKAHRKNAQTLKFCMTGGWLICKECIFRWSREGSKELKAHTHISSTKNTLWCALPLRFEKTCKQKWKWSKFKKACPVVCCHDGNRTLNSPSLFNTTSPWFIEADWWLRSH